MRQTLDSTARHTPSTDSTGLRRRSTTALSSAAALPASRAGLVAGALVASTALGFIAGTQHWSPLARAIAVVPWVPVGVVEVRWARRHFPTLAPVRAAAVAVLAAGVAVAFGASGVEGAVLALCVGVIAAASAICARHAHRSVDRVLATVFECATSPSLVRLTRSVGRRRFRPGDVVVAEGHASDELYVVASGVAEVTRVADAGELYLTTYDEGSYFGEIAMVRDIPRTASVRAISPLELLVVPRAAFEQLLEREPMIARAVRDRVEMLVADDPARADAVPLPPWSRLVRRIFKHPAAMHYNRLILVVLVANLAVAVHAVRVGGWWTAGRPDLQAIVLTAQANFAVAIVVRQQYVINALSWLATRPPVTWPLRLRWMLGKYYHFGGLHVGAAIAGTLWYLAFVVTSTAHVDDGGASVANVVLSWTLVAVFTVIVVLAMPRLRAAQHDRFEWTHRFLGWLTIVLVAVNTLVFVDDRRGEEPLAAAVLAAPAVWLLVLTTLAAAWPWLLLRRVPITVEHPSAHAAVVLLDHGVKPPIGSTRPISRQPLIGWHHFANVPVSSAAPQYRMVVSRAGDWTTAFIDAPPTHVWIRGIPTMGVANVRKLFRKVVLVATGSGIGPMLGHLLDPSVPSRLVWVTKNPRRTYGDALIDEIEAAQPDAVIWDTDDRGKPDVLRLAYGAYLDSGAEAVVCIANRAVTWQVVHGLEQRGIPAFGPIWDS